LWRTIIDVEAVLNSAEAASHDDAQLSAFINMRLRPDEKVLWSGRVNRMGTVVHGFGVGAMVMGLGLIWIFGIELIFGRHFFRDSYLGWAVAQLLSPVLFVIVPRFVGARSNEKDAMFAITDQRIISVFPTTYLPLVGPSGVATNAESRWGSRIVFSNPSITTPEGKSWRRIFFTVHDRDRVLQLANEAIEKARLRAAASQ
jgi:hypothetical protein